MESKHIGSVGQKLNMEVTYVKTFEYHTHYTYYGETHFIHSFRDAEGNVIVWNSTAYVEDKKLIDERHGVCKTIYEGSVLKMTATVKEHSEYKEVKQTVISRPRFTLVSMGKSPEEIEQERAEAREMKKQQQLDSIGTNDFVWVMPYKQFKEHYSDCETLIDSYKQEKDSRGNPIGCAKISVIIRSGRLKNSGVRGEHFSGYELTNQNGERIVYRAVSEENALKRAMKEFPFDEWECTCRYRH